MDDHSRDDGAPAVRLLDHADVEPQPHPVSTISARLVVTGGQVISAITRIWAEGDLERCRLCDVCDACRTTRSCLKLVKRDVPPESAPTFATRGLSVQRDDGHRNVAGQRRVGGR